MAESDEEEYCSVCGDPEFDEDENETHLDEKKYDHDFEYEEEEEEVEESVTLEDVKTGLDVLDKSIDVYKKILGKPPPKGKFIEGPHSDAKAIQRHNETIKWAKIGIIVAASLGILAIIFS